MSFLVVRFAIETETPSGSKRAAAHQCNLTQRFGNHVGNLGRQDGFINHKGSFGPTAQGL